MEVEIKLSFPKVKQFYKYIIRIYCGFLFQQGLFIITKTSVQDNKINYSNR